MPLVHPLLQIEAGGDLFAAFESGETNIGEMIGLLVAAIILLLAFGSIIAMGLPIGIALFGIAVGASSMGLLAYLVDVPSWAPVLASMVGLGVGIDYALLLAALPIELVALNALSVDAYCNKDFPAWQYAFYLTSYNMRSFVTL